jgi:hypothetical protein
MTVRIVKKIIIEVFPILQIEEYHLILQERISLWVDEKSGYLGF